MSKIILSNLQELSPKIPVDLQRLVQPSYGRVLQDFSVGEVFVHPRGVTVSRSFAIEFATQFMEANPLYLNREYARAHGFQEVLVSPLMVLNVALSLGVQNDSEKAIAHLGYYNVKFCEPVYPGDTLMSYTKVTDVRLRGEGQPGIVSLRTVAANQNDKLVLQYDRKIMVAPAGNKTESTTMVKKTMTETGDKPVLNLPEGLSYPRNLTGLHTYFDDFKVGDTIIHPNGRTITDEHYAWTYRVMNTHPLHYDRLYQSELTGKAGGEPVVYGGLVFAWLCGLASRDVSENALWDMGYTEGYHTQPAVSGDTVLAVSRVLHKEDVNDKAGIVSFQLIGVKNTRPADAIKKYGTDLFIKENDKKKLGKEKIPEKIFEIERRLLIKK